MTSKERSQLIGDFRRIRSWVMCNLPMRFNLNESVSSFTFTVTAGSMQSIVGTCDDWIKKLRENE